MRAILTMVLPLMPLIIGWTPVAASPISSAIGSTGTRATDSPPNKLVLPDDLAAIAHRHSTGKCSQGSYSSVWPKVRGEICPDSSNYPTIETDFRFFRATTHLGFDPVGKHYPFGRLFEEFSGGWGSYRITPEAAKAWSETPPLLRLEAGHALGPKGHIYIRGDLRRDLRAWHEDPMGLNIPLGAAEVNLNEPSLGYLSLNGDVLALQLGRFPLHWGPAQGHSLALSSAAPHHDGFVLTAKMPRARYHFLYSSLNSWLEGTPPGGTASENYPVGSEEYRQRNYSSAHNSNPHKRVYAERIKTLVGHRLTFDLGRLELGITEIQVIGGKAPDFVSANPFSVFHNGFHDGFTNGGVGADFRLRAGRGFHVLGEAFFDDLEWSATEGDGNTPSLFGYLGGVEHALVTPRWSVMQSLTFVYTQPFLYHFFQPYNTLYSRHILSSNFQRDEHDGFIDKFVVDYPVGYIRGGDAVDLWYSAQVLVPALFGRPFSGDLRVGWLRSGDKGLYTPFEEYFSERTDDDSPPSGTVEREFRVESVGNYRLFPDFSLSLAAGYRFVRNESHVKDRIGEYWQAGSWVSYTFSR